MSLYLKRNEHAVAFDTGTQLIVYESASDALIVFNQVARDIWSKCENLEKMRSVAHFLSEQYDVSLETAERDIEELAAQYPTVFSKN